MGVGRRVAGDPRRDAAMDEVRHDDEEPVLREACDRQVRLDAAALVQPLGVDDPPDGHGDVVCADPAEDALGVATLHEELGHQRHVEHPDRFSDDAMLVGFDGEGVAAGPTQRDLRVRASRSEPFRVFPARRHREMRAGRGQAIVDDRPADVARRRRVPVRPGRVAEQRAELLDRPVRPEPAARLEWLGPVDGQTAHVDRRHAVDDPRGEDAADAAAQQDAKGVEPGCHEVAVELGDRPQLRRVVRGEALRAAEHRPDAGVVERREAIHRAR